MIRTRLRFRALVAGTVERPPASRIPTARLAALLAVTAVLVLPGASARAFHDGGVASCGGCHVTHNSANGAPIVPGPANDYALRSATASELCLLCHARSAGAVLGLNPLAPPPERGGGNFVFLLEENLNDAADGATRPIPGSVAGHNVVAPAYGLTADTRHGVAPGGSFPSVEMSCTSCHDPHGRSNFRMLWGAGAIRDGLFVFSAPAPEAKGLPLTAAAVERRGAHSAYVSGMSAWCGNCHGDYHRTVGTERFEHPNDALLTIAVVEQYNRYRGVLDPTGGSPLDAYLPEVPFEDPAAAVESTAGPTASSRLSCLTCHRAHASSAPAAGRWDFAVATLGEDGVVSGSWPIPNPYGDPSQPGLCWKCHAGGAPPPTP